MRCLDTPEEVLEKGEAMDSDQLRNPYLLRMLGYLRNRFAYQLSLLSDDESSLTWQEAPRPEKNDPTPFGKFVLENQLSDDELTVLLISLAPHVLPGFFDRIVQSFFPAGIELTLLGGTKGQSHRGTLPTGETALFILAGSDMISRIQYMKLLKDDSFLFASGVLSLQTPIRSEPFLSGRLIIDQEFAEVFITGKLALPKLSISFPAQHITTQLNWEDLVLSKSTHEGVQEIQNWITYRRELSEDWGMKKHIKPGFRVLFYGPPGTGKTLTATLLGKHIDRSVFRIDLSTVVSKYIGETEKNLAALFSKAENKNWILFFDEADAIFGKRTGVRDAHDKYANQEVSYLLQKIESHAGLIILASNFKNNIDHAFIRRFNSIVYFPSPGISERLSLWEKAFPKAIPLDIKLDFEMLARNYELTGSQIINVVQHVCLSALSKKEKTINIKQIEATIVREFAKEGR